MKRKFYVFMAIISSLIFGFALFFFLKNVQNPSNLELKPLVVAASDIQARSIIQPDQLEIKKIPLDGYPQGGASSLEAVKNKVLLVSVKKGDVLLSPMFVSSTTKTTANSFSVTVPEGKRAVAIPVNEIGSVGYKVKPGDRVDILVTVEAKDSSGNSRTITSLAAQDVLVLNTGDGLIDDSGKTAPTNCYIVALSVSQAMSITFGSEKGMIRLLLRNPANKETRVETPFESLVYNAPTYFTHYK